jgi:hypothetical protein
VIDRQGEGFEVLGTAVVVGQGEAASTAARARSRPLAKECGKDRSAARVTVIQPVNSTTLSAAGMSSSAKART